MHDNDKLKQVASLHLDSTFYDSVESYEEDVEKLAKEIKTYMTEQNYLESHEPTPKTHQHLLRLELAEAKIYELTNMCAHYVCRFLY